MCKLNSHGRRYPLNYGIELSPVSTTNQLAACTCRSAVLLLFERCHFRMNDSAPSCTRQNHLPAYCSSCHPFATLQTSFQRPTQPFSGAPSSSPSLAPLSCPYQTPRSVTDACPSYVRISQTIFSVCARTIASMLSKTVLPARRRTIGVWSSRLRFRHPRRRRSMEWCARRSLSRSDLFGLHVMQPLCTTGSFR